MAKLIFGHVMTSTFPLMVNDLAPGNPNEYYTKNWLPPGGIEVSKNHSAYGGWTRQRPKPRTDVIPPIGGDFELSNEREQIRRAKAKGIDGWILNILGYVADHLRFAQKRITAVNEENAAGGSFKIILGPDMNALKEMAQADFINWISGLISNNSAIYKIGGKVVIMPYFSANATASDSTAFKTAAWWTAVFNGIQAATGFQTYFWPRPTALNALTMDTYDAIASAYGTWGERNPATSATISHCATMRARTSIVNNANKGWCSVVSLQDSRPFSGLYTEPLGVNNLLQTIANGKRDSTLANDIWELGTWNDYYECSNMEEAGDSSAAALEIVQYHGTHWKTGSYPAITEDVVYVCHRNQLFAPFVQLSAPLTVTTPTPTAYTTLQVQPVSAYAQPFLTTGKKLTFYDGQQVTIQTQPAVGANSIAINSYTPTATIASGESATQMQHTAIPLNGAAYRPMTPRSHTSTGRSGNSAITPPTNALQVITLLTADATMAVTGQASYTAPGGVLDVKTFTATTGPAPTATMSRGGPALLTVNGPTAIDANPLVQDMVYRFSTGRTSTAPVAPFPLPDQADWFRLISASGNASEWNLYDPAMGPGEWGLEKDTMRLKIGTGVGKWSTHLYLDEILRGTDSSRLSIGQSTITRMLATNTGIPNNSGELRLAYFKAIRSETVTKVRIPIGSAPATGTVTLSRCGIWSVSANGDLVPLATTTSDPNQFITGGASSIGNEETWSVPVNLVIGKWYAVGYLSVGGTTRGNVNGITMASGPRAALAPRMTGAISSLTDLPSGTILSTSIGNTSAFMCADLLP